MNQQQTQHSAPPIEPLRPLLVDTTGVCALLSIGRTRLNQLIQSGQFGPQPVRISSGSKNLYRRMDLEQWIAQGCPPRAQWQEAATNAKH